VTKVSRLLLTVDEGRGSLAAVRALRAAGHQPVVGLWRSDTYAGRSRAIAGSLHLPDPQLDPEGHGEAIRLAAEREGFAAVLPGTEPSLHALADHPIALPPGCVLGLDSPAALARATDKQLLHRLAREAGLNVLPQVVREGTALLDGGVDLDFPVVVKPVRSVEGAGGGRLEVVKVRSAATPAEMRAAVAEAPERLWLVQPLVEGTLEAVCGVAWRGEMVCAVHQESPRIWPPGQGTSSFARTTRPDREQEAAVGALLATIGWSGIFGLQFLRVDGRSYVIDLNPRVYGSMALAIAAGHNLPAIWVELLLGRRPAVSPYRVGTSYRMLEEDLRAVAREWRIGHRVEALQALIPRRRTVHPELSLRDPRPLLAPLHRRRGRLASARATGERKRPTA